MILCHSCAAILDLTDAQITLKSKNIFFLLFFLITVGIKEFCIGNVLSRADYVCVFVFNKHTYTYTENL